MVIVSHQKAGEGEIEAVRLDNGNRELPTKAGEGEIEAVRFPCGRVVCATAP